MDSLVKRLVILGLVVFVGSLYLPAQGRMVEMTGLVTDAQGGVIPGAEVTATNEETGVVTGTLTNDVGWYTISGLIPGPYRVEAALEGFKTGVRPGLLLAIGDYGRTDFTLEVGEVTDQIIVTGTAPLLKTETGDQEQVITERPMQRLPVLNRLTFNLITLDAVNARGGPWPALAGGKRHHTGMYINGTHQQGRGDATPLDFYYISTDIVKEFRIIENSFSAEFKGDGNVSFVTKSGTNDFHGSFYFYRRDDGLNANAWGATSKTQFWENDGGFTLGGPIVKDKTHFFGGWQYRRLVQANTVFWTIPTALEQAGDFSQSSSLIFDPTTSRPDPNNPVQTIRDPFPGNVIPASRMDPVGAAIASFYPQPNNAGASNFTVNAPRVQNFPQANMRLDHSWNERNVSMVAFTKGDYWLDQSPFFGPPGTDGEWHYWGSPSSVIQAIHTHTPNPLWVYESAFSMNDRGWLTLNPSWNQGYPQQLGLKGTIQPEGGGDHFPWVSVAGYHGLGGQNWSNNATQSDYKGWSVAQRFSTYQGRHGVKFGVEMLWTRNQNDFHPSPSGELAFGAQPTGQPGDAANPGNAFASLLLGWPMSGTIKDTPIRNFPQGWYALYFNDAWKVADNFTFNIGVRWEVDTPMRTTLSTTDENYMSSFNPDLINPVCNCPGVITYNYKDQKDFTGFNRVELNHFMPRIGLAWQPAGAGSGTVVRAGAGIFFTLPIGGGFGNWESPADGLPGNITGTFSSPDNGITAPFLLKDGFLTPPAQVPGAGFGAVTPGQPTVHSPSFTYQPDFRQEYSMQWNFSIQQEIPGDIVLEVAYLAVEGRHNFSNLQWNQVHPSQFGPGVGQLARPFPQYGNVNYALWTSGTSNWHAAKLRAEKRYSHGLSFLSTFVFLKALATAGDFASSVRLRDTYNTGEKAMYDAQFRTVHSLVYDLPWGPGRKWMNSGRVGSILGGWIGSGIIRWQAGQYLDVNYFTNTTNGFTMGNQGVNISGNPNLETSARTPARWFNTDAFSAPDPYTFGTAGRTLVQGAGNWNVDMAIHKIFRVTERLDAEIRADLLNALNHANWNNPGTNFGAAGFGQITGKGGSRTIQLGFRIVF